MLTINSNLASLTAQRHLSSNQGDLETSMRRLSSGLRVNSAKDDAAGLAIAERMNAQVRGMNVAVRNANDAISLSQTAEGALGQVGQALQRMRELTVQALNGTNSDSDRDSLNKEFGELQKEIKRLVGGTSFNGKAILGADAGNLSFQVGANTTANDTISISSGNLAAASQITTVVGAAAPTAAQLTQANGAVGPAVLSALTTLGYPAEGQAVSDNYGSAGTAVEAAMEAVRVHSINQGLDGQLATIIAGLGAATTGAEAYAAVLAGATTAGWGDSTAPATTAKAAFEAFAAIVPVSSAGASIGSSTGAAALDQVAADIDTALDYVNEQRASFGAAQNRLESVVSNLQIGIENQSAARGRIMDADFAAETARLSRAQILQQVGAAMVAQANQQPQSVLQLLR